MECEICKSTEKVSQRDWESFVCANCLDIYLSNKSKKNELNVEEIQSQIYPENSKPNKNDKTIEDILLFPIRLIWNIIVTALIVTGFVLWFGFIFGSVLGVILILIFAPDLFLLPLALVVLYVKLWRE